VSLAFAGKPPPRATTLSKEQVVEKIDITEDIEDLIEVANVAANTVLSIKDLGTSEAVEQSDARSQRPVRDGEDKKWGENVEPSTSSDESSSDFVPTPGPRDAEVVESLAGDDPVSAGLLEDAFTTAAQPWAQGMSLQELSDAYQTASYWYAVAKDKKRRARNDGQWGDEEVLKAQLAEDYLEALCKGLDKSLMVAMALAKYGGA
jgi:hypothetical protein